MSFKVIQQIIKDEFEAGKAKTNNVLAKCIRL